MKTVTSLVVSIVISSVLDERLVMHVTHRGIIEPGQNVVNVAWRTGIWRVQQQWSSSCLELAVKVFTHIDHCFIVTDMPKALVE